MAKKKNPNNYPLSFMGSRNRQFKDSAYLNSAIFNYYFNKLLDISIAVFKYSDLPESIDVGYLEYLLISRGAAIIAFDDVINDFIVLQLAETIEYNYAHKPYKYRGISPTIGYNSGVLDNTNSVVIYNNLSMLPSYDDLFEFARRLYTIQTTIDININAQKTPIIVKATENQRLTMMNLYQQYDGNQPFIFADKSLDLEGLSVLNTNAPFVAEKLDELKNKAWNEALTYLGVSNIAINKKERLITDEVTRSQGGVIASRYSRLQARENAIEHFNKVFNQSASVEFREDLTEVKEGGENEQVYNAN